MSTLINRTEKILSYVKSEIMDKPKHLKAIEDTDNLMKEVTRDYIIKEARSWISAGKCYVFQNSN